MPLREKFGKRLKEIRKEKDLTQRELAERSGISVEAVSNLERGIHAPAFDTLDNIAAVLDEPIKSFFDFEE